MQTLHETEDIRGLLADRRRLRAPVVIGSGPLGLEASWAMAGWGCRVTLIERASRLLPRWLDEAGSAALQRKLAERGAQVLFEREAEAMLGRRRGRRWPLVEAAVKGGSAPGRPRMPCMR